MSSRITHTHCHQDTPHIYFNNKRFFTVHQYNDVKFNMQVFAGRYRHRYGDSN